MKSQLSPWWTAAFVATTILSAGSVRAQESGDLAAQIRRLARALEEFVQLPDEG